MDLAWEILKFLSALLLLAAFYLLEGALVGKLTFALLLKLLTLTGPTAFIMLTSGVFAAGFWYVWLGPLNLENINIENRALRYIYNHGAVMIFIALIVGAGVFLITTITSAVWVAEIHFSPALLLLFGSGVLIYIFAVLNRAWKLMSSIEN